MGALFSKPPTPPPIPVPPPAAAAPTIASAATATAANARGRAAGAAASQGGTVGAMGPEGLKAKPMTADVTLLGASK